MKQKISQLRELSDEELIAKKGSLKKELFDLRYQAKVGRVDKPHRIKGARKEIARIETILNDRLRQGMVSKKSGSVGEKEG